MRFLYKYSVFLAIILLTHNSYAAECIQLDDCVKSTEPLVVSATRWETTGIPTANSITVISREEIIQSGKNRIIDVLRNQGGIQIQDFTGDGSRAVIDIRGFGSTGTSNTLVMIDGRRLNPTDLSGPNINLITLKDVERIEITKGTNTVLYGDQAVGGVINIITRKHEANHVEAEAGFGSFDSQFQILDASYQLRQGLSARISYERRRSDNYRDNNALKYDNAFAGIDYEFERGKVFIDLSRTYEDIELPGALFPLEFQVSRKQSTGTGAFNDSVSDSIRTGGTFTLTKNWEFAGEYTLRNDDVDGALNFGGVLFPFKQKRLHKSLNPRLRGNLSISERDISIILGADLEDTDYLINGLTLTNSTQTMESVYGLVTLPVTEQFSVTAGYRKAWVENEIFDGFAFTSGTKLDDDQNATTIGFSYRPTSQIRLFAKREDTYRFPLIDEETNFFGAQPSLNTQTGESWEGGVEYSQSYFFAKATAYRLDLENELIFNPVTFQNENLEPTIRHGVIFEMGIDPMDNLSLNTQYSYTNAEFDAGTNKGNRIPLVSEHQIHFSANYNFLQYWSIYGDVNLFSDRIIGNDFTNTSEKLEGYAVSNLNLRFDNQQYFLHAGVNNIFDKNYETTGTLAFNPSNFLTEPSVFPAPERNFVVSGGIRF